jgi:RimJ/RimL family protein N-acetyltransferase
MTRCSPAELDAVLAVLKHDSVFPFIYDDGVPGKDLIDGAILAVLHNPANHILSPRPGVVFMFLPVNHVTYEIHTNITNEGDNRKRGASLAMECARWMVENTPVRKFITKVPAFNRPAAVFARRCGMRLEGRLTSSFQKDGRLYDEDIFGFEADQIMRMKEGGQTCQHLE